MTMDGLSIDDFIIGLVVLCEGSRVLEDFKENKMVADIVEIDSFLVLIVVQDAVISLVIPLSVLEVVLVDVENLFGAPEICRGVSDIYSINSVDPCVVV